MNVTVCTILLASFAATVVLDYIARQQLWITVERHAKAIDRINAILDRESTDTAEFWQREGGDQ